MIQIITGEDLFSISDRLKKIELEFIKKTGSDFGVAKINGDEKTFPYIRQEIISNSFFQNFKLVIIKNFLSLDSDSLNKLYDLTARLPKEVVLILVQQGKADSRKLKKWEKEFKIIKFDKTSGNNLVVRVKDLFRENAAKISDPAALKLIEYCEGDLLRIKNEVDKLSNYKNNEVVEIKDVEDMVEPSINSSIFNLIDAISAKNQTKAMQELTKLLENNENELYILSMIAYGFRNIIMIKDAWLKGNSPKEISQKLKMHPFVVSKTLGQINRFQSKHLLVYYGKILDADVAIKTGKRDPRFVLEMLVSFLSR